jgi:hypothetical protein
LVALTALNIFMVTFMNFKGKRIGIKAVMEISKQ